MTLFEVGKELGERLIGTFVKDSQVGALCLETRKNFKRTSIGAMICSSSSISTAIPAPAYVRAIRRDGRGVSRII